MTILCPNCLQLKVEAAEKEIKRLTVENAELSKIIQTYADTANKRSWTPVYDPPGFNESPWNPRAG